MTTMREVLHIIPEGYFVDEEHKRLSLKADDEWQKAKKSGLDLDYARATKYLNEAQDYYLTLKQPF